MAEEKAPETDTGGNQIYYVLGAIVLVAVVVAGYMLRSKTNLLPSTPSFTQVPSAPTPTPGPITRLACERQYYNPVIGFAKYYLSVEGGDVSSASKIECTFTASVAGKVVASESAESPLTPAPERGGSTFRCTTQRLDLEPNVPTKVDVAIKDNENATASCSAIFSFPTP